MKWRYKRREDEAKEEKYEGKAGEDTKGRMWIRKHSEENVEVKKEIRLL